MLTRQIMNNLKMNNQLKFHQKQNGAALLVTMLVLSAITLMGLTMANSSKVESVMARNSQLQLEAWNHSYLTISRLLNNLNTRTVSQGIPDYISSLIESGPPVCVNPARDCGFFGGLDALGPVKKDFQIQLDNIKCVDARSGSSAGLVSLNELVLLSETQTWDVNDTEPLGIGSSQRQRFQVAFASGQQGTCTPETEINTEATIP